MRLLPLGTYLFLCLSSLAGLFALYTNEPSVKLLTVGFFAIRYETQDSEYRESVTGGKDVPADIDPIDEANGMPNKTLVLKPGGCAKYILPAKKEEGKDELYLMVKPGKKIDSNGHYNYKDKANITLTVTTDSPAPKQEKTECGVSDHDRSGEPSAYCMLNISTIVSDNGITLGVEICVPQAEVRPASLWELWISPEDDSKRAMGTFEEKGRELFRKTEPFKTWLTMTSIVGKAGVGKSTVASFLAGNMSMFTTGSSSDGTTTVGTDISPIIPISDYITVLDKKLREGDIPFVPELYKPENTDRPLFFMDSEGMSFRGDEFDFITSGPAAIVAKSIVWITIDRFHAPDILDDIGEYLDGLDRISVGDNPGQDDIHYGDFLIVLNKMQEEDSSDEEMLDDLLGYSGDEHQMETLDKLEEKFESVSVIGLPMVRVEEGEEFGYSVLPVRFREGLTKLANQALRGSESPRNVFVGNKLYEMNSTQAIPIMSMLMEAANSGNIDLSDPCVGLYSFYQEMVNEIKHNTDMDIKTQLSSSCTEKSAGILCTDCVCPYRTKLVDAKKEIMIKDIEAGQNIANYMCTESVANRISNLMRDVTEWSERNICKGPMNSNQDSSKQESIIDACDISQMLFEPDSSIDRTCSYLFLCGTTTIHNSKLNIITNKTFIERNTKIVMAAPPTAQDTLDGLTGQSVTIRSSGLLTGSEKLYVELYGGDGRDGATGGNGKDGANGGNGGTGGDGKNGDDGGNGGNGKNGKNGRYGAVGVDGDNGADGGVSKGNCDASCGEIYTHGNPLTGFAECHCCNRYCQSKHCGGFTCTGCCKSRQYRYLKSCKGDCNDKDKLNGKNGGKGGKGGDGEDGTVGTDGINGHNGMEGKNGEDGEDGKVGVKGGNGIDGENGGNAGEAGRCIITEDVDYDCHRFGGKAGIGGMGGMGGKGGKGGKAGKGGLGGLGGKGGLGGSKGHGGKGGKGSTGGTGGRGGRAGYVEKESRQYNARVQFMEEPRCVTGGGWCSADYTKYYESCDKKTHETLETEKMCYGRDGQNGDNGKDGHGGHDGMDGNDGKPGMHGDNGKPGHDGIDGIDGNDGEPGQRGTDGKPGENTKSDLQMEDERSV